MRRSLVQRMLILSEKDVKQCLSMKDCLSANKTALISLATGQADVPTRIGLPYVGESSVCSGNDDANKAAQDWTLFKPASYANPDKTTALMGMKVVSPRANNPSKGFPLVPATILTLDAESGQADALVAATYLTGCRTAAGSALATELLRPDLQHLVVFGAGLQAELHILAIRTAIGRPIPKTTIINRSQQRAAQLQEKLWQEQHRRSPTAGTGDDGLWTIETNTVRLDDHDSVADALLTADCVVTSTNTTTPLWRNDDLLKPGCHINGIGSYTPEMQEVPVGTVDRCRVLVDTPDARSVGDLKHLNNNDRPQQHRVFQLIGEALFLRDRQEKCDSGKQRRTKISDENIHQVHSTTAATAAAESGMMDYTFYKSVGTAIQDILTARIVVQRARELGVGVEVEM